MTTMLSAILPSRRSTGSTSSSSSSGSERSVRCPTPNLFPPSISYGSPTRPNIELCKPVWEVSNTSQTVSVTGEIEVDVSMFRRGQDTILPFSIGIHFTCAAPRSRVSSTSKSTEDDSEEVDDDELSEYDDFRGEWNQDGPGNYYRRRSFIQIHPRLVVDDICYTKFTINVPASLLPRSKASSRVFNVAVKAYELGDPFNVTEPSMARFMVLNRAARTEVEDSDRKIRFSRIFDEGDDTDDSDAASTGRPIAGCAHWKIRRSLSSRIKRSSGRYTFLF